MLKRLRPYTRYLRPVRWQFIGALIAGLIYGVASGAGIPLILEEVLPRMWVEGPDPVPYGDRVVIGVIMVGGMGIRCASEFANMYGMAYCGQRVLEGLRTDTFAHLQKQCSMLLLQKQLLPFQSINDSLLLHSIL